MRINSLISSGAATSIFALLLLGACEMTSEKSIKPSDESTKGGRKIANSIPPGGCPTGYTWNNQLGECVRDGSTEPTKPSNADINPANVTFYTSQTYTTASDGRPIIYQITPGSTINGSKFYKFEILYTNGTTTGHKILAAIKNGTSIAYTNYYEMNGKSIGLLTTKYNSSGQSIFYGFQMSTTYNSTTSQSRWGTCVASVLNQFVSGNVITSAAGLACMAFGPECAIVIGVGCLFH